MFNYVYKFFCVYIKKKTAKQLINFYISSFMYYYVRNKVEPLYKFLSELKIWDILYNVKKKALNT